MVRELAAYMFANGFAVEIDGHTLIIHKNAHCYTWSLAPYSGASYTHRDILLNAADQTIKEIEDLMGDGEQDPGTYGQSVWELWRKRACTGET